VWFYEFFLEDAILVKAGVGDLEFEKVTIPFKHTYSKHLL
jgi:hypothetical protein